MVLICTYSVEHYWTICASTSVCTCPGLVILNSQMCHAMPNESGGGDYDLFHGNLLGSKKKNHTVSFCDQNIKQLMRNIQCTLDSWGSKYIIYIYTQT